MTDNKHFIHFLNRIGVTVNQLASKLNISYATARNRVETLNFTWRELIAFSEFTSIPLNDIIMMLENKKSIIEMTIPYALTEKVAFEKISQSDDFVRMILECSFIGAQQYRRTATQQEINTLKKHFKLYQKT